MTSALYLEHYLDGLEHLPNELQRNFTLMRDLDTRAQTIMKQIDGSASDFMGTSIKQENVPEEERKLKLKTIQDLFNKAKEYGDDKVQLAIQTYELVDKHIRRLDSDLSRFETEIHDKTVLSSKSEENVSKKGRKKVKDTKASTGKKKRSMSEDETRPGKDGKNSAGPGKNSKNKKVNQEKENRKNQKKNVEVEETSMEHPQSATEVLDMPVDPNEPTYCLCHQVSYGEMIGCDNSDCSIEWFHFACVGLTLKPKGKWYCPKCTQDRKKK